MGITRAIIDKAIQNAYAIPDDETADYKFVDDDFKAKYPPPQGEVSPSGVTVSPDTLTFPFQISEATLSPEKSRKLEPFCFDPPRRAKKIFHEPHGEVKSICSSSWSKN